jgi:hypothetical protein
MHLFVSVLRLDVIGKSLGLLKLRRVVVVVIVLRTDVVHLVDAAALGASLDRALAGELEVTMSAIHFHLSGGRKKGQDSRRAS